MSQKNLRLLDFLSNDILTVFGLDAAHGELVTFGPYSSRIAEEVRDELANSEVERDDLGLQAYLGHDEDQEGSLIEFKYPFANEWERFFQFDPNICQRFHPQGVGSPFSHSRACFGIESFFHKFKYRYPFAEMSRYWEKSSKFTHAIIPIFLVDMDSPSAAAIRSAINALPKSNDKSPMSNTKIAPPLVFLVESRWSRENRHSEFLLNCLATLSDIVNWSASDQIQRGGTPTDASVLVLTTEKPMSQDTAIRTFIRQVIRSRTSLISLLREVEVASVSTTRSEVAAASIPKLVLRESGEYQIETIDSADTAYEDIQRRLLNTEIDETQHIDTIMLESGWLALPLLDSLPMQKSFTATVLRGYIVKRLSHLENSSIPNLNLTELKLSLFRAMVRYGPLGFTSTESFEWRHAPDTSLCDDLYALGRATSQSDFKNLVQSANAIKWIDSGKKFVREHEQDAAIRHESIYDPNKSIEFELVRELLAIVVRAEQGSSD